MESLDASRQIGLPSILNHPHEKHDRLNTDRPYTSASAMSTTQISPLSYISNPPPPYSNNWAPTSSHSGIPSPPDSRRTSDNEKPAPIQTSQPHRPSLPSINSITEPLSATSFISPPGTAHPYSQSQRPHSASQPYPPSDRPPYPPSQISPLQRQPSPQHPTHSHSNPFARAEERPGAPFAEPPRHSSISSFRGPPAPATHYPTTPYESPRHEYDPRSREPVTNGYHHPPPNSYAPSHAQAIPIHQPPVFTQPRFSPRDSRDMQEWKLAGEKQDPAAAARQGVKRHLDVWDFENNLAEINTHSNALQEWSSHYNAIAQEQQRMVGTLPARMPTLDSVHDMMRKQQKIYEALERMTTIINEQAEIDQRTREQGNRPSEHDNEQAYGEDMRNHGYISESKKRRGRAAPPGRCHSCSRAETPEWRRGPDGARTLCNACGLHYAKLTRKQTIKQSQTANGSSLRPKSMDETSPRQI